ncbi:MAG: aspartate/glutamate racemase family protein [Rhodovibrionaceae bacterium]
MSDQAGAIGVFDSGHGGLTVWRALQTRLPEQRFLYLGDHANAPYGEHRPEEILAMTRAGVERLFELDCRLVVLACNTAAAVALRRLQEDWLPGRPGRRILGIFVPTVEALTGVAWAVDHPERQVRPEDPRRGIAVFATTRTVESGAYGREIRRRAPGFTVAEVACPGLVAAIEGGAPAEELAGMVSGFCRTLAQRMAAPEAVVLGCTHFPLVAAQFRAALPENAPILSQAALSAESLAGYLLRHPEFAVPGGGTRFLTTGDPRRIAPRASALLGESFAFEAAGAGLP